MKRFPIEIVVNTAISMRFPLQKKWRQKLKSLRRNNTDFVLPFCAATAKKAAATTRQQPHKKQQQQQRLTKLTDP